MIIIFNVCIYNWKVASVYSVNSTLTTWGGSYREAFVRSMVIKVPALKPIYLNYVNSTGILQKGVASWIPVCKTGQIITLKAAGAEVSYALVVGSTPTLTPGPYSSRFINILIIATLCNVHTQGGMPMVSSRCIDSPRQERLNCTVTFSWTIITGKLIYNCGIFWNLWWIMFRINIICLNKCNTWLSL